MPTFTGQNMKNFKRIQNEERWWSNSGNYEERVKSGEEVIEVTGGERSRRASPTDGTFHQANATNATSSSSSSAANHQQSDSRKPTPATSRAASPVPPATEKNSEYDEGASDSDVVPPLSTSNKKGTNLKRKARSAASSAANSAPSSAANTPNQSDGEGEVDDGDDEPIKKAPAARKRRRR